jgi:competence protein ComEA
VPAEHAELARSRVTALSARRGWVPRVPPAAATGEPDGTLRPGRHAKPANPDAAVELEPVDAPPDHAVAGGWAAVVGEGAPDEPPRDESQHKAPHDDPPQYGPVGSAIVDRLPLPVRAVVEGLPPGIRQGRAGLQPAQAAVVVLLVLLGLTLTVLLTGLGRPQVQAVEPAPAGTILATGTPVAGLPGATDADGGSGGDAGTGPQTVVVHVAGEVANPGIVELPAGSRVIDAIEAAGGAGDEVDLTPLNLARVLSDGEQVAVGVDQPPEAVAGPAHASPGMVSLNHAGAEQFATLPGIGPTLAARIVQWRELNGRFTAVDELLEVSGIGPAKFEAIAELVTL